MPRHDVPWSVKQANSRHKALKKAERLEAAMCRAPLLAGHNALTKAERLEAARCRAPLLTSWGCDIDAYYPSISLMPYHEVRHTSPDFMSHVPKKQTPVLNLHEMPPVGGTLCTSLWNDLDLSQCVGMREVGISNGPLYTYGCGPCVGVCMVVTNYLPSDAPSVQNTETSVAVAHVDALNDLSDLHSLLCREIFDNAKDVKFMIFRGDEVGDLAKKVYNIIMSMPCETITCAGNYCGSLQQMAVYPTGEFVANFKIPSDPDIGRKMMNIMLDMSDRRPFQLVRR